MLLIAGLIGLFASGLMVVLPEADETDAEGSDEYSSAEDETEVADQGDASTSVLDQMLAPADDDTVPESPEFDVGAVSPIADTSPPPDTPEDEVWRAARDQIGGDHLTDGLDGSSAVPISFSGDAMLGNTTDDEMIGGDDHDLIDGNGGSDRVLGGAGRDFLSGGSGNDTLDGGTGDDILHGDGGDDSLFGGEGEDLISGGDGDDVITGGDGNDRLFGGEGHDTLNGGSGDDILDGTVMNSLEGADIDDGDRLVGGEGNDTLAGGSGDVLNGGSGNDHFLFRAAPASAYEIDYPSDDSPVIEDFSLEDDVIEIMHDGDIEQDLEIVEIDGGTHILMNGVEVARLIDVQGVGATHIRLIPAA